MLRWSALAKWACERGLRSGRVPVPAGIDDDEVLAQRPQRQRRRHLAVEPHQPEVVVDAAVAGVDQRVAEAGDDGVVQQFLQPLQFLARRRRQPLRIDGGDRGAVPPLDLGHLGLVGGLGIDRHGRALDDAAELVGGAGQFESRLDELDSGPRVDRQDPLRLQHAQRVAERPHRNARQLHQFVLGHVGAGGEPLFEQRLEDARVGEVAEPRLRRRGRSVPRRGSSSDLACPSRLIYEFVSIDISDDGR